LPNTGRRGGEVVLTIILNNGTEIKLPFLHVSFVSFRNWFYKKDSSLTHEFIEETDDNKHVYAMVQKKDIMAFKFESDDEISSEDFD